MGRVNEVAGHAAVRDVDLSDTQPASSHPAHITYAVDAAMTQSSAHIISVHSSDQSAPWDDLAQALEVVRSGLQNERHTVLTVDQGVSQAAQVRASCRRMHACCVQDCSRH
jgi:hypothetical protein